MKPTTLKTRLTLAYAVGFFLSLAACFATIYFVQRHILSKSIRNKLEFFSREFQYEYMTAAEFTPLHSLLEPRNLPAPRLAAIQAAHPGFRVVSVVVNPAGRLEAVGVLGGEVWRIVFNHGNTAIESAGPVTGVDRVEHMRFEFNEESYGEGRNRFFFLLLDPAGGLLSRSPFHEPFVEKFLRHNGLHLRAGRNGAVPGHIHLNGVRIRILRHVLYDGNVLLLGANLSTFDKNLNRLLITFCTSLVGMLTVSLGIGWLIAGNASKAIQRVTAAAREIEASGDYSKRVLPGGEGLEIDRLADAFNGMTGKTERLLAELKAISENVAHDLRTPLTRMRARAELSLYAEPQSELAGVVAEECGEMLEMVNTTLDITRAECRFDAARMGRLDLRALAQRSLELFSTLAEDKQITLAGGLPEHPVPFDGHASKLQRMIANLLDNAIKFTPRGGTVKLSLAQTPDATVLVVSDTGCGIPAADLPHVFDRFYRSSASRTLPGNGLGLCLVRAIANAHRGEVAVQSTPGKGTVFTVRFHTG